MIRVLIVDDSPVVAQALTYILSSDPGIRVLDVASTGEEAIRMTALLQPDIVTMDIHMPGINGFEATRRIMRTTPVPIVIVSSYYDPAEISLSFQALEAGALAILVKPVGIGHPAYEKQSRALINTVKSLADVNLITRPRRIPPAEKGVVERATVFPKQEIRMVAIGASTGGPQVLLEILSGVPKNFSVPITIVQHITQGFTAGFATWLGESTGFSVCVPENGETCQPGTVYVAPDNVHLEFDSSGCVVLNHDPPDNQLKPSVAHLFQSTAKVFREKAIGILLTGMGTDGAEGLKLMRDVGAVTIAQDQESSIVFGMNGEAVKLGAAQYVLSPGRIAETLVNLVAKA